jgi:hypothetical protein
MPTENELIEPRNPPGRRHRTSLPDRSRIILEWFRHSRRIDPIKRSAHAFCRGLCGSAPVILSARRLVHVQSLLRKTLGLA